MKPLQHRLYFFTGKGGVGKSEVALALAQALHLRGQKVLFCSFGQSLSGEVMRGFGPECLTLSLKQSTEEYMASKLGSKTVAKWILKTAFFSSFLDVLPGLQQVIFLGHLIDRLERDAELCMVVDGPSSGHALNLFEAGYNFKKIFKSGLLFQDIERMHRFLYAKGGIKAFILVRPSSLDVQEGVELEQKLAHLNLASRQIVLNGAISHMEEMASYREGQTLRVPDFLQKKMALEARAIEALEGRHGEVAFPYFLARQTEPLFRQMVPLAEELL